jgi:hypothetical protein
MKRIIVEKFRGAFRLCDCAALSAFEAHVEEFRVTVSPGSTAPSCLGNPIPSKKRKLSATCQRSEGVLVKKSLVRISEKT